MSRFSMDWSELSLQVMITFGHFLWQACLIGFVLFVAQYVGESLRDSQILRRRRNERSSVSLGETDLRGANIRYTIACVAFFSLPICVIATFAWVHQSRGPIVLVASAPVESPMASANEATPTMADTGIPVLPPPATPVNAGVSITEPIEPPTLVVESQTSPVQRIQAFAPYLLLAYIVGVGLMLARFSMSILGSSRLRRTIQPITDVKLLRTIAEQCARVGLKRVPIVALCHRVSVPVVVGIVKPMILLPPALLCGLDPSQIAAILSHEIAHIRRYDLFVNLLQRIVEAFLFFHPVTWWISRRVSLERENCCDDMAATDCGRVEYAAALLRMAEQCASIRGLNIAPQLESLAADGGSTSHLGYRIKRLLGEDDAPRIGLTRGAIACIAIAVVCGGVSVVAMGQSGEKPAEDQPIKAARAVADSQFNREASNLAILQETFRLPEHGRVGSVAFQADSGQLTSLAWETASDQEGLRVTVRNWSLDDRKLTGEVELEWQPGWTRYVSNLLLSQDCKRVVGLLDGEICEWAAASGEIVKRYDIPDDIKNDSRYSVSLSHLTGTPDLSRIAFGRSVSLGGIMPSAHAIVMDMSSGHVIQQVEMEHRVSVQSLALSSDGTRLATVGSQHGATIWDVDSGQFVLDFQNDNTNRAHPDPSIKPSSTQLVSSVGFSPDGKVFAISDMLGVKLADTQTGKVLRNIDAPYRYHDANSQFIFSADSQLFALLGTFPEKGEPRTISIWSVESGERLRTLSIEATAAAFSADGKWFAAGKSDAKEALAVWQLRETKSNSPAAQPAGEANQSDSRTRLFKLIDGENGTPLHGIQCKASIFKQDSPVKLRSYRSRENGIVEVEVAEGEGAWIAEVSSGWFTSAASATMVELDKNGKPKHEQTAVNGEVPTIVRLWRGTVVDGRLLWPDKTPAAGVKLTAGVYVNNQSWKQKLGMDLTWHSFDHGDWPNWSRTIVTDEDGKFRVTVPPEDSRFWFRIGTTQLGFMPQTGVGEDEAVSQRLAKCVPLVIQYGWNSRNNELITRNVPETVDMFLRAGDLQLETGVIVRGRVVDAEGKGLSNVHLTSTGPHGPHSGRSAVSGDDGKFEFPAMAAGNLTVHSDARLRDVTKPIHQQVISRDAQAVFVDQSFTIPSMFLTHEITVRAVPHTEVTFEWVDRRADKTQPIAYYGAFRVSGYMPDENGKPATYWTSETERVERDGKQSLTVKIPTQLLNAKLMLAADSKVTASYSDSTGVTSGPGIVPLGDITANTTRTIFGDEPREPEDSRKGPQRPRNEQSSWTPTRPLKATDSSGGSAKILDDHSVRLEGDAQWQEASLQFAFDKPKDVQEIRLEILPVDSPRGPQFGRGGEELMLFDVKPSIEDQAGEFTSLDFASCTYLQNPSDDTTANCIDDLSDTGWKVPKLPADAAAHVLVLRFEKPITLQPDQRLTLTVDSGGADDLAVLNRIRVAFHQGAVAEPRGVNSTSGANEKVEPWEISKLYEADFLRNYLQDHEALPKPIVVPAVRGKVFDPDGKPASGVSIVSHTPRHWVDLDATLAVKPHNTGGVRKSKQDGTFGLPERNEPYRVLFVHESGVANVSHEELLRANGIVTLQKWASVTGTVKRDRKPQAGETIILDFDTLPWSYSRGGPRLTTTHRTTTDKDGNFSFDHVPPLRGVALSLRAPKAVYECKSGKNTHIEIGAGNTETQAQPDSHDHHHDDVNQEVQPDGKPQLPRLIVKTVDADGKPVPDTGVLFYDRNSQRAGQKQKFEMINKRTSESGVADFGVMPNSFGCLQLSSNKELAGCYTLISASMNKCTQGKPERANVQTEIKDGILTVTFTITPHVDLEFNIVDDATNEIVFWSEIFYQDPTTNRWWQFGLVDGSQRQHNFIPISPQITRETIRISALGYETKVFRLPDELDRSQPIRRDIRLKPMPDVELKVVSPDGTPAEKARLTFQYPNELDCLQDHELQSDTHGIVTTKFPPNADIGILRLEHSGGTAELSMQELLDAVKQNPGAVVQHSIQLVDF